MDSDRWRGLRQDKNRIGSLEAENNTLKEDLESANEDLEQAGAPQLSAEISALRNQVEEARSERKMRAARDLEKEEDLIKAMVAEFPPLHRAVRLNALCRAHINRCAQEVIQQFEARVKELEAQAAEFEARVISLSSCSKTRPLNAQGLSCFLNSGIAGESGATRD